MSNFKGKHGPLLIAEIGGNHEGNFEYAQKLGNLAMQTDVDYIKFQIYSSDKLVSIKESPQRNQHFKKFELTKEQHISLAQSILSKGYKYLSSVWDLDSIAWIEKYMDIFKIGSGDLTAFPILRVIAGYGKPIVLSTGLARETEVLETVDYIQQQNAKYKDANMLAILQCTSMYPIDYQDCNLNVMQRLKELTGLTIGYSDHSIGWKSLAYAYAMGAEVLEFHFTDEREGKCFRDHKVSLTVSEVKLLIDEIEFINTIKGNPVKMPLQIEIDNGHVSSFRRAVYPSMDIPKGSIFTEDNLTVLRPNNGIDARRYYDLLGETSDKDLEYHSKLSENDFQVKKNL